VNIWMELSLTVMIAAAFWRFGMIGAREFVLLTLAVVCSQTAPFIPYDPLSYAYLAAVLALSAWLTRREGWWPGALIVFMLMGEPQTCVPIFLIFAALLAKGNPRFARQAVLAP